MKKKITSIFIILFITLFAFNVKASEYYDVYASLQKSEDSRELYNSMPTEVQKGSVFSVKVLVNNIAGWQISDLHSLVQWDKDAFELVETNGRYLNIISNYLNEANLRFITKDEAVIDYYFKEDTISENNIEVVELKFKVKNSVKDGVYQINIKARDEYDFTIYSEDEDEYYSSHIDGRALQFQVGKTKVNSSYSIADIEAIAGDKYVIGNHLFTNTINDVYDGVLTTQYIMLASKSIESDNKDDMKIYVHTTFGDWNDAITNQKITPPTNFEILSVDMKETYLHNGVYSDNNDTNILRIVQFNKNEAIVTIESNGERVHGIATINGDIVTLQIDTRTYQITILENSVKVTFKENSNSEWSQEIILSKRANRDINDYFNGKYSELGDYDSAINYFGSAHTGKYIFGNYELYLLRNSSESAKICLKEKSQSTCEINTTIYRPYFDEDNRDKTYILGTDEIIYGFKWTTNEIQVSRIDGNPSSPYYGTYTKEKSLSMDDVFHIWEENDLQYKVTFLDDNNELMYDMYIKAGKRLTDPEYDSYYGAPYKDGYEFLEWTVNGNSFNINTPINEPKTLVATFVKVPDVPTLDIDLPNKMYYEYDEDNGIFKYHLKVTADTEFYKYEIIDDDTGGSLGEARYGEMFSVSVPANTTAHYSASACILVHNSEICGMPSSTLTISPKTYTVTFDSNGGSAVDSITVPYNGLVTEPDMPTRSIIYTFGGWRLNGEPYNFNEPLASDITLVAHWDFSVVAPTLGVSQTDSFYEYGLFLSNYDDYCTSPTGCNMSENDHYSITGYEVFRVDSGVYHLLSFNVNGKTVSRLAPYEYASLTLDPNEVGQYVARAYVKDGAETLYTEYSNPVTIDTTLDAPIIAFNPSACTVPENGDIKNCITVTNLISSYGYGCDGDNCASYKTHGFKLYKKDGNEYVEEADFGNGVAVPVSANNGEQIHYFVAAYQFGGGIPVYSDYSNELVLGTATQTNPTPTPSAPTPTPTPSVPTPTPNPNATYACYVNIVNGEPEEFEWTNNPKEGWQVFPGATTAETCA